MSREVVVVGTGTANLASVRAALQRLDVRTVAADSPEQVLSAERVLIPGVGTFGAAMQKLNETKMSDALRLRVRENRALCGICVGMQVLFDESEESPGIAGLGCLPGTLRRFAAADIRVPQMGWNAIEADNSSRFLRPGWAYFANSYAVTPATQAKESATWAWADYGGPFAAAVERGNLLGCQFHPELSAGYGEELLARWLEGAC